MDLLWLELSHALSLKPCNQNPTLECRKHAAIWNGTQLTTNWMWTKSGTELCDMFGNSYAIICRKFKMFICVIATASWRNYWPANWHC